MHRKLLIVGDGPELEPLQKIAGQYTNFLGKVGDEDLKKLYSEARGFIFPGVDDFGMTPIRARASGCPVIAFRAGGAVETVIENVTGVFFQNQSVADLIASLERFEKIDFDSQNIRQDLLCVSMYQYFKIKSGVLSALLCDLPSLWTRPGGFWDQLEQLFPDQVG